MRSLERRWEPDLVVLYAECRPADATRQLEQAVITSYSIHYTKLYDDVRVTVYGLAGRGGRTRRRKGADPL